MSFSPVDPWLFVVGTETGAGLSCSVGEEFRCRGLRLRALGLGSWGRSLGFWGLGFEGFRVRVWGLGV